MKTPTSPATAAAQHATDMLADELHPTATTTAARQAEDSLVLLATALSRPMVPSAENLARIHQKLGFLSTTKHHARPSWLGWAAAVLACSGWATREHFMAEKLQNAEFGHYSDVPTPSTDASFTNPEDAGQPDASVVATNSPKTKPNQGKGAAGGRETVTILRQDFEKLRSELSQLRQTTEAATVANPRIARPTVVELSDPKRPPDAATPNTNLSQRIGSNITKELDQATKDKTKEPAAEPPPKVTPKEAPKPAVLFERTSEPLGTFTVPGGVVEIGGGYFYDPQRNVIMEPTGDGSTFLLRKPGPDFDPKNPRLAPVTDLSKRFPAPEPIELPEPEPEPDPITAPAHLPNGFAWVDQTNGEGSLIIPPGLPPLADDESYWLWMTVPGLPKPVPVGRLDEVPINGGNLDFSLQTPGLIPESFLLTRETTTAQPTTPSTSIVLKGP